MNKIILISEYDTLLLKNYALSIINSSDFICFILILNNQLSTFVRIIL